MKRKAMPASSRRTAGLRGVSFVEIVVVVGLSSLILTAATLLMSRTTRVFQKTSGLMTVQSRLDGVLERMKADVRGLVTVTATGSRELRFLSAIQGTLTPVIYSYDAAAKTLTRMTTDEHGRSLSSDFSCAGDVVSFYLNPVWTKDKEFRCLELALTLRAKDPGEGKETLQPCFIRLFSHCREEFSPAGWQ